MLVVWLVLGLYIGIGLHINYRGDRSAPNLVWDFLNRRPA